jgi:hypothetical protein
MRTFFPSVAGVDGRVCEGVPEQGRTLRHDLPYARIHGPVLRHLRSVPRWLTPADPCRPLLEFNVEDGHYYPVKRRHYTWTVCAIHENYTIPVRFMFYSYIHGYMVIGVELR